MDRKHGSVCKDIVVQEKWEFYIQIHKHWENGESLGLAWASETLKSTPSDTLPPARPYLLISLVALPSDQEFKYLSLMGDIPIHITILFWFFLFSSIILQYSLEIPIQWINSELSFLFIYSLKNLEQENWNYHFSLLVSLCFQLHRHGWLSESQEPQVLMLPETVPFQADL